MYDFDGRFNPTKPRYHVQQIHMMRIQEKKKSSMYPRQVETPGTTRQNGPDSKTSMKTLVLSLLSFFIEFSESGPPQQITPKISTHPRHTDDIPPLTRSSHKSTRHNQETQQVLTYHI